MVPARGGSKSIPHKNLAPLAGRPLLDYGVLAARSCIRLDRIICSTEDDRIAERARTLGIEVDNRPQTLAGDDIRVSEVAKEMLERLGGDNQMPEILVLVQPTSPFLLPAHVDAVLEAMANDPDCRSGQTITPVPHNYHAWNQRVAEGGRVRFSFAEQRAAAYNKQRKTGLFTFGNLVATRAEAILEGEGFFADPSAAVEIPWPYNLDVDTAPDLTLAESLISTGTVVLPNLPDTDLAAAAP